MAKRQGSLLPFCTSSQNATMPKRARVQQSSSSDRPASSSAHAASGLVQPAVTHGDATNTLTPNAISPPQTDLGKYKVEDIRALTNQQKYWLLKHAFRLESDFKFPTKVEYAKSRAFQHTWLKEYPWLSYSTSCNGGFCVNCTIFTKNRSILGQLVTAPMTNFTRAKQTLREHSLQGSHQTAMEDATTFMGQMESGHLSVQQQLQSHASLKVQKNRVVLKAILKTIIFCGKQNIALRGHRETVSDDGIGSTQTNPGNFLAMLQFRIDAGDTVLKEHFLSAPGNAQYRAPSIQNELIAATGEWIQEKILQEVRAAKFFTVCADEAADASNKEQLPLVLRFVDQTGVVREEFIEFVLCESGTAGEAIARTITATLTKFALDPNDLRGQGYDGAGNMAGKYKGAAALIQQEYPKALYVHCAAHTLNLCVVAACSIQAIQNMQGTLQQVCLFFNFSPKRQAELEKQIKELPLGVTSRQKLVNLCKTRWVARIEAYEVFGDAMPAVVNTLETISTERGWNLESAQKASSLLSAITQFEFLMAFMVARHGLGFIRGLTTSLQSRLQDICNAYSDVDTVKTALHEVRDDIDACHKMWYESAVALGETINASPPSIPRRCARQVRRSNVPADSPEEYYRRAISIPFLDEMITHLNTRFSETQQRAMRALSIVPSVLMATVPPTSQSATLVEELLEFYKEDMPTPSSFQQELHLWKCKWRSFSTELPNTPSKALYYASEAMFPNIHCLLRIICTLPVTSCECERSVSVLRRLKTYLRTTIGQERLTGLALMHVNYGMDLNLDEIVNIFARQHPRRMLLLDILNY